MRSEVLKTDDGLLEGPGAAGRREQGLTKWRSGRIMRHVNYSEESAVCGIVVRSWPSELRCHASSSPFHVEMSEKQRRSWLAQRSLVTQKARFKHAPGNRFFV